MLPNILDIAEEYNLTLDKKSYGKKETLAKCPFCKEDEKPNKTKTYYLSLNTKNQVYKCWFCKESGGVLRFEANLSNLSFTEVRQKHFGKHREKLHSAFKLTPEQLEEINWLSIKQKSFRQFQKCPDQIWNDWKRYVYYEHSKHFALFMCMAHLEGQKEKQKESLKWLIGKCEEKPIPDMYSRILTEYNKPEAKRYKWARRGTEIARIAWKTSIKTIDINLDDLYVNVLFIDYFLQHKKDAIKK